ncbi:hypothetical protein BUALT_Bualt04G0144200 [Buddleja alternifolia]|uniref:Ribosomal protein L34e superfamily protein n=1 Tax=Buddleja alternifolia TaxID=168488 RepID=A0AAV6Y070_9LAMI|nr:hypothetical protein BUALT_Bualt04G0144200 [Buddleja alternifolia]
MVCFDSSILVNKHIDMPKSTNPSHRNKKAFNCSTSCDQSSSAIIDVIIMIAVSTACMYLLYPYITVLGHKTIELGEEVIDIMSEEILHAPVVFGCLGLSVLFAVMAIVAITVCADRKCGRSGCRGLREAAEFDIQLETEECVKKSSCLGKNGLQKGLFELRRDHHKELEAELKKMAPPNGRAVLVFRASCGCSIGTMEVPGPRKYRKVKK